MEKFKNAFSNAVFGMSKEEAHKLEICVDCKQPVYDRIYTDAGHSEYQISGMCEVCFDNLFTIGEEE